LPEPSTAPAKAAPCASSRLQPDVIPQIKQQLSGVSFEEMKIAAKQVIACATMDQVYDLLNQWRL
jgi:phosphoenolpyruvate-protein kinase (PTS system EI component)